MLTSSWVAACAMVRHLQAAKQAVYQAVVQQGMSVEQVAAQRHIQLDSVQVRGPACTGHHSASCLLTA